MYKPKKGIVLYQNVDSAYAEIHDIDNNGEFGTGRPLRKSELISFNIIAKNEDKILEKSCFPYRNILGFKSNPMETTVAWIYPAQKVNLLYRENVKGIKSGIYHIPNIVFVSNGNSVDVYAIKRKDILNLSEDTILYHAPFMNIGSRGDVCMGSAKVEDYDTVTEMIDSVEQAFFQSIFTHTNHNNIVEGGILDCYNNQKKKFDEKLLIKCKRLKEIWK